MKRIIKFIGMIPAYLVLGVCYLLISPGYLSYHLQKRLGATEQTAGLTAFAVQVIVMIIGIVGLSS